VRTLARQVQLAQACKKAARRRELTLGVPCPNGFDHLVVAPVGVSQDVAIRKATLYLCEDLRVDAGEADTSLAEVAISEQGAQQVWINGPLATPR